MLSWKFGDAAVGEDDLKPGELMGWKIENLDRYAVENRRAWCGIWGRSAGAFECLGEEMMELVGLGARDVWTGELDITEFLQVR